MVRMLTTRALLTAVMTNAVSRRELLFESAAALTFGSAFLSACGGEKAAGSSDATSAAGPLPPEQPGRQLLAQSGSWKQLPVGAGGFVTGIDFSADGSTKVIRTDTSNGYVWDDGAKKWRPLFTGDSLSESGMRFLGDGAKLSDGSGVYEARVAPSDPNRIYAVFYAQVFKSTDRGLTFTRTSLPPKQMRSNTGAQRLWGPKMAVDPANPDVVYLGTEVDGLWRTLDGGTTWTQVADVPKSKADALPLLLAFDATSGTTGGRTNVLYVSSDGNGVYRSSDAGASFALTQGGPTRSKRMICDQTGALWFLEYGRGDNLSKFSGGAWSRVPTHGHWWHAIAINPADARHLFMISDDGFILQSFDGGANWMGPWFQGYPDGEGWRVTAKDVPWLGFQQDMSAGDLRFDPSAGNKLYFAMGVGVLWSNPPRGFSRVDWNSQSAGIEQLVASWVLSPPGGDPLVLAWDRPIFKISDVNKYPDSYGPKRHLHHGWHADYAVDDPSFIVGLFNYNHIHEEGWSADGGKTWTKFEATPSQSMGGCIAVSTRDNIVVVPSNNGAAVYTKDRGRTWTPISIPGLPNQETGWGWAYYLNRKIVAADRVKPGVFYLYNYGPGGAPSAAGLYRSIDGGATWVRASAGQIVDWSLYNARLQAVPGQMGHLFFTTGALDGPASNSPFKRSKDGGSTWESVPNVFEVTAVGFGKPGPNSAYPAIYIAGHVNSEYGIWASLDDCRSWTKLTMHPAGNIDGVNCISGDANVFGRVYIGFMGSGFAYGDLSAWAAA